MTLLHEKGSQTLNHDVTQIGSPNGSKNVIPAESFTCSFATVRSGSSCLPKNITRGISLASA